MKRFSLFLLISGVILTAALLSALSACGRETDNGTGGYVLYFPEQSFRAGTGALRAVPAALKPDPRMEVKYTAAKLLMELLNGPQEDGLLSPFPPGTALRSLDVQGSRALADFSGSYGTLSGVALTLADYSVALTLTQIPQISVVRITVRGQELAYRDKKYLMARDVLMEPETDVVGTLNALLYFPDGTGSLVPEERELSLYEGETQVKAVTEAVEAGPEDRSLLPAFPDGFRVRSVWQEGDICFVNLTSALLDAMPESADLSACLEALDLSLMSLDSVGEVRYLVDGEFLREYNGVSLAEPYARAGE